MKISPAFFWSSALVVLPFAACGGPDSALTQTRTAAEAKAEAKAGAKAGGDARTKPDVAGELDEIVEVDKRVDRPIDDALARTLADEGRGVMSAIEDGLEAAKAGNKADTTAALARAREGLKKLEADRPNIDIAVEVWRTNADLEVEDVAATVDTIPLLATLMRLDVPVFDAKEVEARHGLRKAQAPAAATTKDKATDLEIVDSNLVYTELDLPLALTKIHVLAAQALASKGELAQVQETLERALASFGVMELVEQAPEYQARGLVWDAKSAFVRGDMLEARRLLAAASERLEPIRKDAADPQAQTMATMLLAEMKPLRDTLKPPDTAQLDVLARVGRNAMSLARRTALRVMMASRREQERFALADGLMWLEKAGTEGLLVGKEGAGGNLVLAEAMIDSAAKSSPPSAKAKLDDLHARIQHLIGLDVADPRDAKAIADEYRGVTFRLRMLMLDLGLAPVPNPRG